MAKRVRVQVNPYVNLQNDPNKRGSCAAPKLRFGDYGRYAIAPVHTRFRDIQWFVWDAHVEDRGLAAVIRQAPTLVEALAGLECDPIPAPLRPLLQQGA